MTVNFIVMVTVILIGVLILGAALAAVEKRRTSSDPTSLIRVTQVIAIVWAGVSAVGALVTLLVILLSPTVSITMPITPFWPNCRATFGPTRPRRHASAVVSSR